MQSSIALRAGELLGAALIAAAVLLAVTFGGVLWLRRTVRRRLEGAGLVLAGRAREAAAGAASAGWRWLWSRPLPDRRWRSAGRAHRQLWRAVSAAEHAVAAARGGGAPTGELGALCRRLRQAAGDADRSLAIQRRAADAGALEAAASQVTELVSADGQIQAAVAATLGSSSRLAASGLADDVHREAQALAAGMASAAAAPGGLPGGSA